MFFSCGWKRLLISVVGAVVVAALVAVLVLQPWNTPSQPARYPNAVVAANGYECASVGRQILEKNGSAVDAAIATLFCEGMSCAQCMGLGGGFLSVGYDAESKTMWSMNARERAPLATTTDMYLNASSTVGGLAIAVPGELRGYGELYKKYGRLAWRELVMPAEKLAREGHRVTNYMGRVLQQYSDRIKAEPTMRELYVNPATGQVYQEGDMIKEPTLAETLAIIGREGAEAMHNGSLTPLLMSDLQALGSLITEEDLRNFKVEWQEPTAVPLTDTYTLYTSPLPGSGSVLAFMLNMLRGWVGVGSTEAPVDSNLYWHRLVETYKYAYAKRTGLGDPNRGPAVSASITELVLNLTDPAWAKSFHDQVDDTKTFNDWQHYGAMFENVEDHGTAQIVVVAPDGSVASVTSTVNYIWGSQRRSTKLGIILNNEMDDFSIPNIENAYGMPPSPANMLAPGLQPLSSMTPSFVLDNNGEAKLVLGAAGGTKITTQVASTVMHNIWEEEPITDIIQRHRIHHQLVPMEVEYEEGFNEAVLESLKEKGHALTSRGPFAGFAAMVAAERDRFGYLTPITDPRRVGSTDGI